MLASSNNKSLSMGQAAGQTALHVGTVLGGVVGGLLVGKLSFYTGIGLTAFGLYKKNQHLALAGTGMMLTPHIPVSKQAAVNGFDVKQITEGAKERVSAYFKNFSEKLYLGKSNPNSSTTISGLHGSDPVTYFISPYGSNADSLDMSALDRVQEQIAQMNAPNGGYQDISEHNF
ncbi:MAG: hypothetical protein M3Q97_07205 [Bacteroidota bacterium]|nr:hypothetical protein [Bacteroidota bacterium]